MNKSFGEESNCLKISSNKASTGLILAAVSASSRAGPDRLEGSVRILERMVTSVGLKSGFLLGFWEGGGGGCRCFSCGIVFGGLQLGRGAMGIGKSFDRVERSFIRGL